jgi:hypothetical protein
MNIYSIYAPFLRYFRSRRMKLFGREVNRDPRTRILDVGGYHWFWTSVACRNPVTCLNIDLPVVDDDLPPQFTYVQGDGRDLPYQDAEYGIVFSNSVIEHLGDYAAQKEFAAEIRRVGKSYWVQTPNRWFFVEPHLIAPFIHYFPKAVQRCLIRWFTLWGLMVRPTPEQVDGFLAEVRLLTEPEMRELFPDARIEVERFLGLKKSIIAIRVE